MGVLLCSLPAWADLDKARHFLRQKRYEPARRELASHLRSKDRSERFEAELLKVEIDYNDLRLGPAYRKLEELHGWNRQGLRDSALRQLCWVDAEMEASVFSPERKKHALEQALQLSHSPEERIYVLGKLGELEQSLNKPEEAVKYLRQAGELALEQRCRPQTMGYLAMRRAHLNRSLGRGAEVVLDLAQARRWFELERDRSGLAEIWELQARLTRDAATADRYYLKALDELGDDPDLRLNRLRGIALLFVRPGMPAATVMERLRREDKPGLPSGYALYVYYAQSSLAVANRDRKAWTDEFLARSRELLAHPLPGIEDETRLLVHTQQSTHWGGGDVESAFRHLEEALRLSRKVRPSRRDDILAHCTPTRLARRMAQALEIHRSDLVKAEAFSREAMREAGHPDDLPDYFPAAAAALDFNLKLGRAGVARQIVGEIMERARKAPTLAQKSTGYWAAFGSLLNSSFTAISLTDPSPLKIADDTPAGWLLEELRHDTSVLPTLREWMEFEKRRADPQMAGLASMLYGLVLSFYDRRLEAVETYQEGLETAARQPQVRANICYLLSRELLGLGRSREAVQMMTSAVELTEKDTSSSIHAFYANQLASILLMTGSAAEALQAVDHSIQHRLNEPGWGLMVSRVTRARILDRLGRRPAALHELEQALALARARHATELESGIQLEFARLDPSLQKEHWRSAWAVQKEWGPTSGLGRFANDLSEQMEKAGSREDACRLCVEALELLVERRSGLPAEARKQFHRFGQAQPLLERAIRLSLELRDTKQASHLLALSQAFEAVTPVAVARPEVQQLEELRVQLSALQEQLKKAEGKNDERLRDRLTSTKAEFLSTLNRMRAENPHFDDTVVAQGSELLALQPRLEPGTLLLQYYAAPDTLYVQAVTREGLKLESVRVERARLKQLVEAWRQGLSRPDKGLDEAVNRQLYTLLIEPVASMARDAKQLLVLPSGDLWSLPLETLKDEQGRYLVERCPLGYLGNADLMLLGQARVRPAGGLVAVRGTGLQGVAAEVEALKRLFPSAAEADSRSDLVASAGAAAFLHIATHSEVNPQDANASFLQLSDGPLKLSDVYGLDLPQGALVVLSSCQSGLGVGSGRELVALSTGFRAAGAASVVSTLWQVDDRMTARFFPVMYEQLLQGGSRAAGLQAAKLAMLGRAETRHPYYWAGFTLLGDPR